MAFEGVHSSSSCSAASQGYELVHFVATSTTRLTFSQRAASCLALQGSCWCHV